MSKSREVLQIAEIDPLFIARDIRKMKPYEVGYTGFDAVGVDKRKHKGVPNPIYIDGKAPILTPMDIITPEEEGGALELDEDHHSFFRIICLGKQTVKISKTKSVRQKAYVVDAAHLNYGENIVFDDKLGAANWDKHGLMPLPVVNFIATALDLEAFNDSYEKAAGKPLLESALMAMSQE